MSLLEDGQVIRETYEVERFLGQGAFAEVYRVKHRFLGRQAVLVVHHARKDSNSSRPGQALRGSSELHGWGDSNLYMRRRRNQLTLSTEHRAAPSQDHIPVQLTQSGSALALSLLADPPQESSNADGSSAAQRVHRVLTQVKEPISVQRLRQLCGMRTASVCAALAQLSEQGLVSRDGRGYQLKLPLEDPLLSLSPPIDPQGNGNGQHSPHTL